MTRQDARIIAEELFKLLDREKVLPDRYLSTAEAANYLNMSVGTLYHRLDEVPHTKTGGTLRFSERALRKYVERA